MVTLVKDGDTITTNDEVVIRAYKLSGYEEKALKAEEPKPAKKTTPKK